MRRKHDENIAGGQLNSPHRLIRVVPDLPLLVPHGLHLGLHRLKRRGQIKPVAVLAQEQEPLPDPVVGVPGRFAGSEADRPEELVDARDVRVVHGTDVDGPRPGLVVGVLPVRVAPIAPGAAKAPEILNDVPRDMMPPAVCRSV